MFFCTLLLTCVCVALAEYVDAGVSSEFLKRGIYSVRFPEDGSLVKALRRSHIYGRLSPSKLNRTEKQRILERHVGYREAVGGANLLLMKWDESLASLAQGLADTCVFGPDNLFFLNGTNVGQNQIAILERHKTEEIVDLWHLQRRHYKYTSNTCHEGKACDAYTQIVWYKTDKVGCGKQFCETLTLRNGTQVSGWWLYVCDYANPGNYPEHPYLPATYEACELCNISPGTKCVRNQCVSCDPANSFPCRSFNDMLCRSDKDPCCLNWNKLYCTPDTAYFNYMALNCGVTCDSYMCLF